MVQTWRTPHVFADNRDSVSLCGKPVRRLVMRSDRVSHVPHSPRLVSQCKPMPQRLTVFCALFQESTRPRCTTVTPRPAPPRPCSPSPWPSSSCECDSAEDPLRTDLIPLGQWLCRKLVSLLLINAKVSSFPRPLPR